MKLKCFACHFFLYTIVQIYMHVSMANLVRSLCDASMDICEFNISLGYHTAMLKYNEDKSLAEPVAVIKNGSIYLRDIRTCALGETLLPESTGNNIDFLYRILAYSYGSHPQYQIIVLPIYTLTDLELTI